MSELSNNIRNFRLLNGWTQKELATKLNRSTNAISNWEKEENSPDVDTLEAMCKLFNCTPNQIYGWDESPELEDFLKQKNSILNEVDILLKQKADIDKRIKQYNELLNRKR